jgi:predicted dehydrogenase
MLELLLEKNKKRNIDMKKIKTVIIGMGKMGQIRLKEMVLHGGFEVLGICDVDDKIKNEFPDYFFSKDWQEVIDHCNADAVFVCTFNNIIPEIVCYSLAKGMHVFSEKPPGRTVADVQTMIDAEDKSGMVLKFGFNHRFHYAIMEAKAMIDSGRFGKVLWARGTYGKAGGNQFAGNWRSNKELSGGGILLDQGIHMLDLLRYFMGDFSEIKSFVENSYWKSTDLEDNAFALMKTTEGKVAMMHSSATQWRHKFNLDLYLEDGYITIDGILSSSRSYGEECITFAKKEFEDNTSAFGKPREQKIYFDKDDSWKLEVEDFFHAVSSNSKPKMGTSKDALEVMKLVYGIYEADSK